MTFLVRVRFAAALSIAAPLLFSSAPARAAGAVLHPATESDPTTLEAEIAVASTPYATTRWMRVHVAGPSRVLWLVPVRPGAAVDWTSDAWLDALDDATAPRVAPPDAYPPCGFGRTIERVPSWVGHDPTRTAGAVAVHLTLDDLHAAASSFTIPAATDSALGAVFASGGAVLSIPIEIPSFSTAASATLRVTDDAPSAVPLALFGSSAAAARIDAIAIAPLPVAAAGARDVDPSLLTWGAAGSSYVSARSSALLASGGAWIREASMREPLFDGVPSVGAPALVDRFAPTCAGAMRDAASGGGAVGRACPEGAAARVPGGGGCAPSSGAIDPTSFACAGSDDLALALSGSAPRSLYVSRLSGVVPPGTLGADAALATSSTRSLSMQAGSYDVCAAPPPVSGGGSSSSSSGGYSGSSSSGSGTAVVVAPVADGTSDSCGSSDTSSGDDSSSSDGCGSSSSESSSDSSSGSNDGCSSSNSSGNEGDSKSNDSCGSSNAAPKKTSMRKKRSPVSRAALLAIALILPLRRRFRSSPLRGVGRGCAADVRREG